MFDFSFGKLAIIFALCLIVLGPEKLPKLAQQLGRLAGQARAMARHFRTQLEQEIAADEIAKQKREFEASLKSSVDAVTNPVDTVAKTATDAAKEIIQSDEYPSANDSGHADVGHVDPAHADLAHQDTGQSIAPSSTPISTNPAVHAAPASAETKSHA